MALDATEVRVAVSGHLYVAAVGTAFPASTAAPWTSFTDAGYLTIDGPGLNPSITNKGIDTWQSNNPLRTLMTKKGLDLTAKLQQTTGTNLKLAFGGGAVTSLGGGDYQFSPAAAGVIDEHAFGLETLDGTLITRWFFYRATVSNVGNLLFKKDQETTFDLTVSLLQPASGDVWDAISNDPAFLL